MTTGNSVIDRTVPTATSCSGGDRFGPRYQKTWSGADRTYESPQYVWLRDPDNPQKYVRKRLKVRRSEVPHNYSATISVVDRARVRYLRSSVSSPCNLYQMWTQAKFCFQGVPALSWGDSPFTNNDDLKLLSKLHSKVHGSDFMPDVFLAEAGKGLRMITEGAMKIARSVHLARRGQFGLAFRALGTRPHSVPASTSRSMANIWAEYKWGWVPLMQDMHDGAEWLAHHLYAPVEFRLAVRRVAEKWVPTNDGSFGVWHEVARWKVKKQLIAFLREPPHNAVLDSINPASVAWEVMPYSFVVDWFLPISTYLHVRGLPSQLSGTFVTTLTSEQEGFGQILVPPSSGCPVGGLAVVSGRNYTLNKTMTRTVSSSLDVPLPVFRGFGATRPWNHTLDVLALLRQKLGGS